MISPESLIKSIGDQPISPVEKWNPDYCGELDLVIKADGTWLYAGTPFTRYKMKLLFSRVIKKEDDNYFLVTPVEKLGIKVEWMPFVIVDHQVIEKNGQAIYLFNDALENIVELMDLSQIQFSRYTNKDQKKNQNLPTLQVRRNLFASFSRQCYYRLIAEADLVKANNRSCLNIISNGKSFSLGEYLDDE